MHNGYAAGTIWEFIMNRILNETVREPIYKLNCY